MAAEDKETTESNTGKTTLQLVVLAISMFIFAVFVMPPIYTLFCEITGLNGKTKGKYEAVEAEVDTSRTVRVQFVASNNAEMPWKFEPEVFSIDVHPGEAINTHFIAHNPTGNIMVGQAVPSMQPSNATNYFHKTECFCFNQQTLAPDEEAKLGLQFIVDQALPKAYKTITLSYSLFDVSERMPEEIEFKRKEMQADKNDLASDTSHESILQISPELAL